MQKQGSDQNPLDFIKPLLSHYIQLMESNDSAPLKEFMQVAPSLKSIRKAISLGMADRETIIYQILLVIVGSYQRHFLGEDSKIYRNEFLPTALEFYRSVDKK